MNNSISPLDGRYSSSIEDLIPYFSEMALMRYRLEIEIEYLIKLSNEKTIKELQPISNKQKKELQKIYLGFDVKDAKRIKKIEKTTNHDVKAVEYFIREKVNKSLHPWIHFALTSEDINNLSYTLMWKNALEKVFSPILTSLNDEIKKLSIKYNAASMLSMTHGQPATPTTFGKELAVFYSRLNRQANQINKHLFLGKFGGATGTELTLLNAGRVPGL